VSALANRFVKDPHEVVKPGQVVKVKVVEVDVKRQRIGLTMKLDDGQAAKTATRPPRESGGPGPAAAPRSRDTRGGNAPRPQPQLTGAMALAFAKLKK
jgi:uncharacterized protein